MRSATAQSSRFAKQTEKRLGVVSNLPSVKKYRTHNFQIENLHKLESIYTENIIKEEEKNNRVTTEIEKLKNEVKDLKRSMPNPTETSEIAQKNRREIEILENKCRHLHSQLNTTLKQNEKIKALISDERGEKQRKKAAFSELSMCIIEKEDELQSIENETKAINENIKIKQKVTSDLLNEIKSEISQFDQDWINGMHVMEETKQECKEERLMEEVYMELNDKEVTLLTEEEVNELKTISTICFWNVIEEGVKYNKQVFNAQEYKNSYKVIKANAVEKNNNEIIYTMAEFEEKNFVKVQRISELTKELGLLESKANELRKTIKVKTSGGNTINEMSSVKKKEFLEKMEQDVIIMNQDIDQMTKTLSRYGTVICSLKLPLQNLFDQLGTDDPVLAQEISASGVSEMNMLPTLASIELKITELSQMYFLYETNQFAELLNIWKGKDKTLLKAFKLKNQINIPEYTPNPNENIDISLISELGSSDFNSEVPANLDEIRNQIKSKYFVSLNNTSSDDEKEEDDDIIDSPRRSSVFNINRGEAMEMTIAKNFVDDNKDNIKVSLLFETLTINNQQKE